MEQDWISIKDRLPERGKLVVGFHNSQLVPVVCFLSQKAPPVWEFVKCCFYAENMEPIKTVNGEITHWLLLPDLKNNKCNK